MSAVSREKVLFALTRTHNVLDPDNEDTCDSIGIYSLLSAFSTGLDSFIMALAINNGELDTILTITGSALEAAQSCLQTHNGDAVRIVYP
jgi:hypothetical protein